MDTLSASTLPPVGLGDGRLEHLKTQGASRKELEETGRKLEGVFLSMVIKQLRETMSEEGLFGEGSAGETYGGLFDQMLGEKLASRNPLGISEMVVRSMLARQDGRHFTSEEITPEKAQRLIAEQRAAEAKPLVPVAVVKEASK